MQLYEGWDRLKGSAGYQAVHRIATRNGTTVLLFWVLLALVVLPLVQSDVWGVLDGWITLGTLLAVFKNGYDNHRREIMDAQLIPVWLQVNDLGKRYRLRLSITRSNVNRAEIQGLLGNFQIDSAGRYNISFLSEEAYAQQLRLIQLGERDELVISMSNAELHDKHGKLAFELSKMDEHPMDGVA